MELEQLVQLDLRLPGHGAFVMAKKGDEFEVVYEEGNATFRIDSFDPYGAGGMGGGVVHCTFVKGPRHEDDIRLKDGKAELCADSVASNLLNTIKQRAKEGNPEYQDRLRASQERFVVMHLRDQNFGATAKLTRELGDENRASLYELLHKEAKGEVKTVAKQY